MSKFGELIDLNVPVLLDFYAEWNEQSTAMHPVLRDVAAALGDKGKVIKIDVERTEELIAVSKGLKFTFHRAFDWIKDPFETLSQLEALGVDCILSSGQQKTALEGINLLAELQLMAKTSTIMPGSGINETNAGEFAEKGFKTIHLSGTTFYQTLDEVPRISMNSDRFLKDDSIAISNVDKIKAVLDKVK